MVVVLLLLMLLLLMMMLLLLMLLLMLLILVGVELPRLAHSRPQVWRRSESPVGAGTSRGRRMRLGGAEVDRELFLPRD